MEEKGRTPLTLALRGLVGVLVVFCNTRTHDGIILFTPSSPETYTNNPAHTWETLMPTAIYTHSHIMVIERYFFIIIIIDMILKMTKILLYLRFFVLSLRDNAF